MNRRMEITLFVIIALFVVYFCFSVKHPNTVPRLLGRWGIISYNSIDRNCLFVENSWKESISQMNDSFDVCFIGTSLTIGGNFQSAIPSYKIINLGVSGNSIADIYRRLSMVEMLDVKYIFIEAGINDLLSGRSIFEIQSDYYSLVMKATSLYPKSNVILQTILPVDENKTDKCSNESVSLINGYIQSLAKDFGIECLNLYNLYYNDIDSCFEQDGVHLKSSAYSQWYDSVLLFLNK